MFNHPHRHKDMAQDYIKCAREQVRALIDSTSTFGWDDEEATPISQQFWEMILDEYIIPLIQYIRHPVSISASEFGSIVVAFDDGDFRIELLFNPDGTYSAYIKENGKSSVAHPTKKVDLDVLKYELKNMIKIC